MRKKRLSKALAMFLAAALTIPAAVPVAASESTADKEETVYVKTDANGEEKTVIVSDWLKNFSGEAKIKDATDLTDVENVKAGIPAIPPNNEEKSVNKARKNVPIFFSFLFNLYFIVPS